MCSKYPSCLQFFSNFVLLVILCTAKNIFLMHFFENIEESTCFLTLFYFQVSGSCFDSFVVNFSYSLKGWHLYIRQNYMRNQDNRDFCDVLGKFDYKWRKFLNCLRWMCLNYRHLLNTTKKSLMCLVTFFNYINSGFYSDPTLVFQSFQSVLPTSEEYKKSYTG